MFYIIDLSKPRKYIQGKYDDIMLEFKLNPPKINKPLITALTIGVIIAAGTTANASGAIDQAQYNYLLDHYVNNLKYPEELAAKLLNKLTVTDFEELYARVQQHKEFVKQAEPLLDITNKIAVKAIEGLKAFMNLYSGM
jgi:histidyl-tRNA synthetase